jgi:hypothetical protein
VRVEAITGLSEEQVAELTSRVTTHLGASDVARPGGRPCALDLYWSIVLVVHLLRKNPTQQVAAAFFNVSQATVSRRWDLLRPILAVVLEDLVEPARTRIGRYGTALVDGTICPTWDWKHVPHLYSTKAGYSGINVQIACDLGGSIAAIGPIPVPGARHDAHAYSASGLKDMLAGLHTQADLGYVGVEGIDLIPTKRRPGQAKLAPYYASFNISLAGIRAAAERAVAHVKTWRMLSEEGGRFRPPLEKFAETLAAITGLLNLRRFFNPTFE